MDDVVELERPAMAEGVPGAPRVGAVSDEMAAALASVQVTVPAQFVGAEAERLSELVRLRLTTGDRTIAMWTGRFPASGRRCPWAGS